MIQYVISCVVVIPRMGWNRNTFDLTSSGILSPIPIERQRLFSIRIIAVLVVILTFGVLTLLLSMLLPAHNLPPEILVRSRQHRIYVVYYKVPQKCGGRV